MYSLFISVNRLDSCELKEMATNFPDAIGNEEGDNPGANRRQEPMPEQSKPRIPLVFVP